MNNPIETFKALLRGVGELFMSCRRATRLISESQDRQVSRFQRAGLFIHLCLCKWCRRYGEHLRFLRKASEAMPEHDHQEHFLPADSKERMRRKMEEAARRE